VGYFPKSLKKVLKMIVREKQWISPRQDHVSNNARLLDISDGGLKDLTFHFDSGTPNLPFTHAETTVNGTTCGSKKNYSVRVAMDDARSRAQSLFFQRIGKKSVFLQFTDIRYTLSPDRISRCLYQAEVIGRNPQRIFVDNPTEGLLITGKKGSQFIGIGD